VWLSFCIASIVQCLPQVMGSKTMISEPPHAAEEFCFLSAPQKRTLMCSWLGPEQEPVRFRPPICAKQAHQRETVCCRWCWCEQTLAVLSHSPGLCHQRQVDLPVDLSSTAWHVTWLMNMAPDP